MKVLLITDGIYPLVMGGMQKHSYYIAKFLSKMDVEVFIVHCEDKATSKKDSEVEEFADFNKERVSFKRYVFSSLDKFPGHYVRESKRYSKTIYNDIKCQLHKYDLIYCKGFTGWKFI